MKEKRNMVVNIHKLIAAINPDIFCDPPLLGEVKKLVKEEGYLKAAEKAEPISSEHMDLAKAVFVRNPFKLEGIKNPIEKHILMYDNFSQALEPIYFWILDYVFKEYTAAEKLVDNFVTSVGSGQFSEMGQKLTRMQEEAMKMMATAGQIMRSILNIIYDLKEFKIRLSVYDDLKSDDKAKKSAALLSLKQIWLDQVDTPKRGTTSIKGFAQQLDYVTLIDAFMATNSLEHLKELDLNDRVKRILEQRIAEFFKWIKESEQELRKRFEIEKVYLKNQVSSVRLYARWIKPYLKAAKMLEQRATETVGLVNSFNTTLLELTLLGKGKYKLDEDVMEGYLPEFFKKLNVRKYHPILILEFRYRSVPERMQQGGYGYRGRIEMEFTSYAMNDDELNVLRRELEKDDLGDLMGLVQGATDESLGKIQVDLDEFLEDKKPEDKEKKKSEDVNPFSALFSIFKSPKKDEKSKEDIPKDSNYEKVIRSQALILSRAMCRKLYVTYKGVNEMPAFFH